MGGPKFRAFSSSATIFAVFCRTPPMCAFGVLGLSYEAQAAPKPPGFHTTVREPKRPRLRVAAFKNTTKTRRHPERGNKSEHGCGRGKKRAKFLGGSALGVRRRGEPEGPKPTTTPTPNINTQTTQNSTQQHNTQQQHTRHTHDTQQHITKMDWPKLVGQMGWPKWIGQNWIGQSRPLPSVLG